MSKCCTAAVSHTGWLSLVDTAGRSDRLVFALTAAVSQACSAG